MKFFTSAFVIQLIASFVTSVAFAVMFSTGKRHLLSIGICGLGTYAIYYTALYFGISLFGAAFISSIFTALFAEIAARIRHAPTIIFLLTGIVPTVPGGNLYRGMRDLIRGNMDTSLEYFSNTLMVGLGIAGGIVAVSIIFGVTMDAIKENRAKKQDKQKKY